MAETIPCPACGTDNSPQANRCHVCDYELHSRLPAPSVAGLPKCPRCGSGVTVGAAFCQVCGQGVDQRHPRPSTGALNVRTMFGDGGDIPMRPPPRQHTEVAPMAPMAAMGAPSFSPPGAFARPGQPRPQAPAAMPPMTAPPMVAAYPPAGSDLGMNGADPGSRGRRRPAAPRPQPSYPGAGFGSAENSGAQDLRRPPTDLGFGQASVGYGSPQPQQPSWAPAQPVGPAPGPRGVLRLVLVGRDGQEGESFVLPAQGTEIGRSAAIAFPSDPFVSPQHARLTPIEGGIHLADLGSRNGVYLRVTEPVPVYPGDFFLLGNQLLRLDRLATGWQERPLDGHEVRGFGTPAKPPWAMLSRVCVGEIDDDRYHLRGTEITIGREQGEIVFPADGFLSRAHARIRMEVHDNQMAVLLDDLDSANGTYLRIRSPVSVPYGGMFRVGDQIFRLRNN